MSEKSPHLTPADVAYQLIRDEARAMADRDLADAVIRILGLATDDLRVKNSVITAFNLDPRMAYLGKGIWGIRDWSPLAIEAATSVPDLLPGEGSYQPKAGDYLWDDDEEDDEDEEDNPLATEEEPEDPMGWL